MKCLVCGSKDVDESLYVWDRVIIGKEFVCKNCGSDMIGEIESYDLVV